MNFCDADSCSSCGLAEGEPACLRRKADFCLWFALRFPKAGIGVALQKLAFDLITESEALERERAVFSRSK
jgi:hypothetical protein